MKFLILTILTLGILLNGAVSAQTKRSKKKPPSKQTAAKIVYEADGDLLRDLQAKVRVVESKKDWTNFDRQSSFANPSKTRTAYVAQFKMESDANATLDVIVVQDAKSDKFYEIRGFDDFPWRPFSDFKWISDDILQFEQWVNPNNGGRYQVNVQTGKIVAAGYVRSN